MNKRRIAAVIGAAAIAGGSALFLGNTAFADDSSDQIRSLDDVTSTIEGTISGDHLKALQDHLGTDADGVYQRLAVDELTGDVRKVAEKSFADDYAGTWTNSKGTGTVVAVSDPALVSDVEALGAKAKVVDQTLGELEKAQNKLDSVDVPEGVYSWSID
ncbi:MAG: hypothetical protein ACRD0P_16350, partial [Stackebrandtia sp.]